MKLSHKKTHRHILKVIGTESIIFNLVTWLPNNYTENISAYYSYIHIFIQILAVIKTRVKRFFTGYSTSTL